MQNASQIAHEGLAFANPMPEATVDAAIAALPIPTGAVVLDTGCGRGEILLRTLRAHPGTRGVGIDLDPQLVAEARSRAASLPVRFEVADAEAAAPPVDAVINVGASHAHGGFPAAVAALRARARIALYGEGFWQQPPSDDFLAALGGASVGELADLDGLRAAIKEAGFGIVGEWLASSDDWAHYEETLAANAERHGGSCALAYARRIRERRALPRGADTLGFALLVLRA